LSSTEFWPPACPATPGGISPPHHRGARNFTPRNSTLCQSCMVDGISNAPFGAAALIYRTTGDFRMAKTYALVGTGGRARMFYEAILGPHRSEARLVALCDTNQVRMDYTNSVI